MKVIAKVTFASADKTDEQPVPKPKQPEDDVGNESSDSDFVPPTPKKRALPISDDETTKEGEESEQPKSVQPAAPPEQSGPGETKRANLMW